MEHVENVYVFEVATSMAYVPRLVTECQAYDTTGQKYDLSPLVLPHSGWQVATKRKSADDRYIINVCHSVDNVTATSCRGEFLTSCHFLLYERPCRPQDLENRPDPFPCQMA